MNAAAQGAKFSQEVRPPFQCGVDCVKLLLFVVLIVCEIITII